MSKLSHLWTYKKRRVSKEEQEEEEETWKFMRVLVKRVNVTINNVPNITLWGKKCLCKLHANSIYKPSVLIMHCSRSINFMLGSNKEMQLKLHMQLNKRSLNIRIKENGHKFSVIRLTFLHEIYACKEFNSSRSPQILSCASFFFALAIDTFHL